MKLSKFLVILCSDVLYTRSISGADPEFVSRGDVIYIPESCNAITDPPDGLWPVYIPIQLQ